MKRGQTNQDFGAKGHMPFFIAFHKHKINDIIQPIYQKCLANSFCFF